MALAVWLACTAGGFLLIDLDVGPKLLPLPMGHGLTVIDTAGAALLLAGWVEAVAGFRQRFEIARSAPSQRAIRLVVAGLGGSVLATSTFVEDLPGRKFVIAALLLFLEVAGQCPAAAR